MFRDACVVFLRKMSQLRADRWNRSILKYTSPRGCRASVAFSFAFAMRPTITTRTRAPTRCQSLRDVLRSNQSITCKLVVRAPVAAIVPASRTTEHGDGDRRWSRRPAEGNRRPGQPSTWATVDLGNRRPGRGRRQCASCPAGCRPATMSHRHQFEKRITTQGGRRVVVSHNHVARMAGLAYKTRTNRRARTGSPAVM